MTGQLNGYSTPAQKSFGAKQWIKPTCSNDEEKGKVN